MRTAWRACRRVGAALGLLWRGLRTVRHFDAIDTPARERAIQAWSAELIERLGLALHVHGRPHPGPALVVANHVSWLDIAALHSSCPQARFVSKADVLRWPVLGPLIRASGTLFIERERKRDALRVVHEVAQALRRGETVAFFPEGTTGPGDAVAPFHANLLQAAISVGCAVQPVVLHYTEPGADVSRSAQYLDDTTLVGSLLRLAGAQGVAVHVHFLDPVVPTVPDRRALAQDLQARIAARLAERIARARA